jgi:SOS-response transcriptional repressor LexA
MHRQKLNQRMRDVFDFIVYFETQHRGVSPSVREIMEGAKVPSTSVVNYYLAKLKDAGVIEFVSDGCTRGIILVGAEWKFTPTALHAELGLWEVSNGIQPIS